MNSSIFRQKNIDKINSPESLNDYVKVTNPSIWIILVGIIILIIGACVFGIIGKVDSNINVAVSVSDGVITGYIQEEDMEKLESDMSVKIEGNMYSIKSIANRPIKGDEVDEYVLHKGNIGINTWVYPVVIDGSIADGVYFGTVTVQQVSPVSYLFN